MNRGLPDNMPGDHTAVPADQTMNTPLIVHPLADVREHLVEYGRALRERVEGIEGHTVFRELIRRHLVRATEGDAIHLVHADEVLVMAFIPAALAGSDQRDLHQEAERTALALLDSDGPPMPIELVSAQIGPPAVEGKCRLEAWLEGDLLDVLEEREVLVVAYFDGAAFYAETLRPQLERRGFELLESCAETLETGVLRVRHTATSSSIFQVPWGRWVRDMVSGGFDLVFLMACLAVYLQKLEEAAIQNP